jgi:hypothetical protein
MSSMAGMQPFMLGGAMPTAPQTIHNLAQGTVPNPQAVHNLAQAQGTVPILPTTWTPQMMQAAYYGAMFGQGTMPPTNPLLNAYHQGQNQFQPLFFPAHSSQHQDPPNGGPGNQV